MISIKKFLSPDKETEQALRNVVRLLIQGIGDHEIAGEADDCALFRKSIRETLDALTEDITPEDLAVHANAVVAALEHHYRKVSRQHALHSAELQKMLTMSTLTIAAISAASDANISRLGAIEKSVGSASELDDVRIIKSRLSSCLADIRNEAERQRQESKATIDRLDQGLDGARAPSTDPGETPALAQDTVTGLPLRPAAEAALAKASQVGAPAFAAVIVLDRLQAVNLQFGRPVGDEVLAEFTRSVRRRFPPTDRLFRWSGPALVALLLRAGNIERVRNEVGHILAGKLEHTVTAGSRSLMIPIAARWAVVPMVAAPRLIYQRIDSFAAALAARE